MSLGIAQQKQAAQPAALHETAAGDIEAAVLKAADRAVMAPRPVPTRSVAVPIVVHLTWFRLCIEEVGSLKKDSPPPRAANAQAI